MSTTITGVFTLTHEASGGKPYRGSLGGMEITIWGDKPPKGPTGNAIPPSGQIITAEITTVTKGKYSNNYIESWSYSHAAAAQVPNPPVAHPPAAVAPQVTPSYPTGLPSSMQTTCFIQACEDVRSARPEGQGLDPFADVDEDVTRRYLILMATFKALLETPN